MKLFVWGGSGKMGSRVMALARADSAVQIVTKIQDANVVIDFSLPEGTIDLLKLMIPGQILVCGTTGLTQQTMESIDLRAQKEIVFYSSNFSTGIAILREILKNNSHLFADFGFKCTINEIHHIHKLDRPSGTSLSLKSDLSSGFQDVPILSQREGEVIGDHKITLELDFETVTFIHQAKDRSLFASAALNVAHWLFLMRLNLNTNSKIVTMSDFINSSRDKK